MIEFFCKYIQDKTRPYIIFDLGSRDCVQSIEFYNLFPNAKIYAFECNPATLPLCRKNIEGYKDRITLIEKAVTDFDGEISFYPIDQSKSVTTWEDGNPGASSLFKITENYTAEQLVQNETKVPCCRLDTIMKEEGVSHVDILWADLQGAELLALRSLGSFLSTVNYIHTEISHIEVYKGQVLFPELHAYCVQNGFERKSILYFCSYQEDIVYKRKSIPYEKPLYDIIIPVGPKDIDIVKHQIEFTKCNVLFYRTIYLLSVDPTLQLEGCTTLSDSQFPISKETIEFFLGSTDRIGWYFQQLLKLYAPHAIPDLLEHYLVVDSDTFFLKPTIFLEDSKPLFNTGKEYHEPYFKHIRTLHPSLGRVEKELSGITHHMLFQKSYVSQMIQMVEQFHQEPFWAVFLKNIDTKELSGASEYELYFNFMLNFHKDKICIRPLQQMDVKWHPELYQVARYFVDRCDYMNFHWYIR